MPVAQVAMREVRTEEQKKELIKGIAKAFEEIGVKAEELTVIIYDVSKTNRGVVRKQASKLSVQ